MNSELVGHLRPRIGLTGSRGVIGTGLKSFWSKAEIIPFTGEIRNQQEIQKWYDEAGQLDAIVHLAALVPTDLVASDPIKAFQVNVGGTLNLLETIRLTNNGQQKPWFFLASSSHVYSSSPEPLAENSLLQPVSIYGRTKLQAEEWAEIYREKFGLPVCIGRIFSYTASTQASNYFLPSLKLKLEKAPPKSTLEIRGLLGTRDFLTVRQITKVIQQLFDRKSLGIFNIGTGTSIQLLTLAQALQKRLGREDLKILSTETDTNHLGANIDKLKNLGISTSFDLQNFLNDFLGST